MECDERKVNLCSEDKTEVEKNDSAHNFQKFIYDLFDKNGILNDLRAYLRGHIVNVLKSAQTGDPPLCQKNFTQRLELVSQALNILIAECLLQLDFTYTLSVFVSEIPLSNMVFDFSKELLKDSSIVPNLRFKDSDIWSVLNYLGVKCDSAHASNIVEMYKNEERVPLLLCILKCIPMYHKETIDMDGEISSRDSLTSSANSIDTVDKKAKVHRRASCSGNCKHYNFCRSCQNRISRLKEKYRERKKDVHKETRQSSDSPLNVESFMKNVNFMEKRIIDEMFSQLQSVYEAEVELVRREEQARVRRSLASHALQLQRREHEMEESLKSKEAELQCTAQHKKQFLWGVARSLREQHAQVEQAMAALEDQRAALEEKENNLKTQLSQAEETLRMKGEEMRVQISKELEILEGHLESMKRERDSLNKERSELENLKSLCDSKTRLIEARGERETEDLKQHYDTLKDEIAVLKKYIESSKTAPKCVVERSTITEFIEVPSSTNVLNNTSCPERASRTDGSDREARPPNQLVNDLKKQKNVNFSQPNLDEMYGELSRERSRCSVSSEEEAVRASEMQRERERDTIQRLIEENESLKDYARQQRSHISALWSERAHGRPRTAPAPFAPPAANYFTVHRINPSSSANTFGWRKGAGEELSLFPSAPPPLLPGDPVPFLGILRDRHADNRRHLINQWRALRRRSSPLARIARTRPAVPIQRETGTRGTASPSEQCTVEPSHVAGGPETSDHLTPNIRQEARSSDQGPSSASRVTAREKSPKTVLKEAKENLRNKNSVKQKAPLQKREKSPNSMLREAKLRLRKLEIEAEAVEKSYLDFRKRQAELKEERKSLSMLEDRLSADVIKNLDVTRSRSSHKFCNNNITDVPNPSKEAMDVTSDFDKYLRDYQTKFDIGETHFKNKNTAREKAKPIPIAYSEVSPKKDKRKNIDYLETPMMEFRKLYHAEKERKLSQLRPNVDVKPGVAKIHDRNKLKSNKKTEQETLENSNSQDQRDETNSKEIENINDYEIYEDENKNDDMEESQKLDNYEIKFETEENSKKEDLKQQYRNFETLRNIKINKAAELQILKDNINKIYNFKPPTFSITPVDETIDDVPMRTNSPEKPVTNNNPQDNDEKNVLRVEVESSYEVNKVKMSDSQEGELVFVVQSSITTKESDESEEEPIERVPLSVEISPKEKTGANDWNSDRIESPKSRRSDSPEKAAQLTRNDVLDAIFHANHNKDVSSVDMHLELSTDNVKEDSSDHDKDPDADYPDDFSADVDNYNSPSEFGNNSPISLPKSDNDNFWDN